MAISTAPFFDPSLAMLQRQLAFDTTTQTADLRLQGQRLEEDQNLFRPFLERRFKRQADQQAGNVAARGFSGGNQGIMNSQMAELGQEQAYTAGEFERKGARGMEDIERAIANLTQRNTIAGAEGVRTGAGNAADRTMPRYPNF